MKRILTLALVAILALSCQSFAANVRTATFGDQNASNEYRVKADANYDSGNTGWIVFAQDTGIYYPYTSSTTNQTLVASQTGTTLVFTGTSNNTRFTLPTATVGMDFTIVSSVAKSMQITPQSTDTIKYSTLTVGQGLVNSSAAAGDVIELFCYAANTWSSKNMVGTWTHSGANP